ncbi:MAG TPA: phosphohistidine phosphatase SixA [Spirochaetota bacterium]|nr:phosphohistidine phosphatase SixA [Spirochaetota bacterium]HPC41484.1 phosphohistidine phosphatase SixA [Spirochaetota bacterium]HPL15629.1 phosphohistidine phosphatase SixA [Spirochaetota bacterium]HQF09148.1 phosphohistidine phosphatase SixA [Spirochaetota bacterium]HQH97627.1 phosphohistidine phosphatase SixA [Spirochaetota bacterium]
MALFLVQHGKAAPAEIDPERGLTTEGRAEVDRIASVAEGYGVRVGAIVHSGKKRARETAEIFCEKLGAGISICAAAGMDPNDDVAAFAGRVSAADNMMLVGHLPFMEKLASFLITGSPDRPVFKFQNGGIVCLDIHPAAGTWVIVWALMPRIG